MSTSDGGGRAEVSESPGFVNTTNRTNGFVYASIFVILVGVGYHAWPFLRETLGLDDFLPVHAPQTVHAPARVGPRPAAPAPVPAASAEPVPERATGDWLARFRRGQQASSGQRPQEALNHYRAALAEVEATLGANDLRAALMLDRISAIQVSNQNYTQAEPVLRRALAILDAHSHVQIRDFGSVLVPDFDRESVQRRLAWTLWELRRYSDSLVAYQRAYDMLDELDLGEATDNARRAYNAAGIMAAACTQGQWARADRAMAELKQRIKRVSARDQQWLDYWVRTGEPRLAARKC